MRGQKNITMNKHHHHKYSGLTTNKIGNETCVICGQVMYLDPKLVVAAIIADDNGIILVKRAIEPGVGKWSFPSGYVNRGETLESAMSREVMEECGIKVSVGWVSGLYSTEGNPIVLAVFNVDWISGKLKVNDSEITDVRVFPINQLPDLAFEHDKNIIQDWVNNLEMRNVSR